MAEPNDLAALGDDPEALLLAVLGVADHAETDEEAREAIAALLEQAGAEPGGLEGAPGEAMQGPAG